MQKLILVGRATRDAEQLESKAGKKFTAFGVAVNRYMGKDKEYDTSFYDCVVFGDKNADLASTKIKKGDLIVLEGRPEADAYIKNKEAVGKLSVVVEDWEVVK